MRKQERELDQYHQLARAMAKLGWLREGDFVIERVAAALRHTAAVERVWTERIADAAQAYLDRPNAVTHGRLERVLDVFNRRDGPIGEPDGR